MAEKVSNLPAKIESLAITTMDVTAVSEAMHELGHGGLDPFSLDHIPFPTSGSLTYNVPTEDGPDPRKFIDAIVVHQHAARQFYEGEYDPTKPASPPRCASYDGLVGQGDPGGLCVECPFMNNGCKPHRFLYLLFPDELFPKLLILPRTSLNRKIQVGPAVGVAKYFFNLAKKGKRAYDVVTRIGVAPRTQGVGSVATFVEGPPLTPEQAAQVRTYAESFRASLSFPDLPGVAGGVDPTQPENGGLDDGKGHTYHDDDDDDI